MKTNKSKGPFSLTDIFRLMGSHKLTGILRISVIGLFLIAILSNTLNACAQQSASQPPDPPKQSAHNDQEGNYTYQAALDSVPGTAFYKIPLPVELVAKCRLGLEDLRIAGSKGEFIPYVIRTEKAVRESANFSPFPIVSNSSRDSSTEIVIRNGTLAPLSSIYLVIRNASAKRSCTLGGSDDSQHWYVIREYIPLEQEANDQSDRYVQAIRFPTSNYRNFRITLHDKGQLPLNILQAGIYTTDQVDGKYQDIPEPAIEQKDSSNKHSYITLLYKEPYRIDKLTLVTDGPALYKRQISIYNEGDHTQPLVAGAQIDPAHAQFGLPPVRTSRLVIDIYNGDNPPLHLRQAVSAQLEQYLLAYLQSGAGYRLLAGNSQAAAPDYDLQYFTDSLTQDPSALRVGLLEPTGKANKDSAAIVNGHSGILLWSTIAIILILLIFCSFKMIKSIAGRENQ